MCKRNYCYEKKKSLTDHEGEIILETEGMFLHECYAHILASVVCISQQVCDIAFSCAE